MTRRPSRRLPGRLDETGWRPDRSASRPTPSNGRPTVFHFVADGAEHVGDPADPTESERIAWVPVGGVRELIAAGKVTDGLSLTALLWALALDQL